MGRDDRRRPQGLGEFFFNELRQAIQDIRQKAVEQGWFGRVTTPKPVVEMQSSLDVPQHDHAAPPLADMRSRTFEEQWSISQERSAEADYLKHGPDREKHPAPEHDIDR